MLRGDPAVVDQFDRLTEFGFAAGAELEGARNRSRSTSVPIETFALVLEALVLEQFTTLPERVGPRVIVLTLIAIATSSRLDVDLFTGRLSRFFDFQNDLTALELFVLHVHDVIDRNLGFLLCQESDRQS